VGRTGRVAVAVMVAALAGAVAALAVSASIARVQVDSTLTAQGAGRVVDSGESV
jgi:hypothetical protein